MSRVHNPTAALLNMMWKYFTFYSMLGRRCWTASDCNWLQMNVHCSKILQSLLKSRPWRHFNHSQSKIMIIAHPYLEQNFMKYRQILNTRNLDLNTRDILLDKSILQIILFHHIYAIVSHLVKFCKCQIHLIFNFACDTFIYMTLMANKSVISANCLGIRIEQWSSLEQFFSSSSLSVLHHLCCRIIVGGKPPTLCLAQFVSWQQL